jgi:hypothetical protein
MKTIDREAKAPDMYAARLQVVHAQAAQTGWAAPGGSVLLCELIMTHISSAILGVADSAGLVECWPNTKCGTMERTRGVAV